MDRYPRLFVRMSLLYLFAGTVMGVLMASNLIDPIAWRFAHLHLNLLGFMTLIVSGVAYHVIPRFMGRPVKHPALIGVHFWLANLGLIGMVAARSPLGGGAGPWAQRTVPFFAGLAAAGAWAFVWNLFPLLRGRAAQPLRGRVDPELKVAEVLERWPATLEVFKRWGFAALANPAARATFAKLVSVEKACRIHKVELSGFLEALNAVADGRDIALPLVDAQAPLARPRSAPVPGGGGGRRLIEEDVLVGDLLRRHPATRAVLERFFGPDCFSCPGQMQETLAESASLHGVDRRELLEAVEASVRASGR